MYKEELSAIKRRQSILEMLHQKEQVSVRDLAQIFHVSDMTVRRDLHHMEEQGILTTHYGGASLRKRNSNILDFSDRRDKLYPDKLAIARTAAGYIQNNDTIFLDTSTTILLMLRFLPDLPLTIVTNSLPAMEQLSAFPQIRLFMAPGIYQQQYGGCTDYATVDYLRRFHYHKAFFGASAVDAGFGASATREIESAIKTTVFSNADQTFLLADHTKFGKKNIICYNDVRDYTKIFTDTKLDDDQRTFLARNEANLIFCE